ncbi:MAG TPA: DUF1254 domain-containing protein [Xanthobacteraceae bacterium]|nr:DUF1254 domain-containing protein [Xanthobacteraceae bacterium]
MNSAARCFARRIIALTLLALAPTLPATAQAPAQISAQEAYEIGVEAYIYFYPLVTMEVTRQQINAVPGAPPNSLANRFFHIRAFPPADFRAVVRPNFDTLYSSAWLDLSKEPMIVSVPDTGGRYYLLPMLDMWSDVFAVPGKRTTGTKAGHFAVVPPGWSGELPAGVERINAPTPNVWIIGRTQTNGPADYAAVHKVQDGYTITPLSQWAQAPAAQVPINPVARGTAPAPLAQVNGMKPSAYFKFAAELLKVNPPHLTDWSIIARLRRIGIEVGQSYQPERLDPAVQDALARAAAAGLDAMHAKLPTLARLVNGWQMNTDTMGVYGDYYLKRAVVASVLLGANQPEDAVYPLIITDAAGKPPTGDHNYILHFGKDELPPVEAFWSLTMYDADGFPVANPINRFALGDRDVLKYNVDGSLDLYIQHDDPGGDRTANWLPAPGAGALGLTMRLYAPKAAVLDGSWAPPPLRRQP